MGAEEEGGTTKGHATNSPRALGGARDLPVRPDKPPAEAAVWAAAVTGLKMGKLGPFDATPQDIQALIEARYRG